MSALVEQKFQRAESDVADGFDSSADVFDEGVAHFRGDSWRRRFFDELLMAQLHRTIALAEADDVAIFIGEDLKFYMARRIHTFFQIERTVAKSRAALRFRCRKNLLQLLWRSDHANAATTAAGARFEHDRITDLLRFADGFVDIRQRFGARNDRQSDVAHHALDLRFVGKRLHRFRRCADENEIVGFTERCKMIVF